VSEPLPGVRELIDALRQRGIPSGLASSSWPGWIEALLGGTGLKGAFDAVTSSKEVAHGKPAPDVYLLTAEKLSVAPERCIAIEDTPTGLAAAKAAGMLAVQSRSASTAFPPLAEADVVLDSLLEFDLSLLNSAAST
jgi:HAD superfamily hydrolase (TIGR01509 family)